MASDPPTGDDLEPVEPTERPPAQESETAEEIPEAVTELLEGELADQVASGNISQEMVIEAFSHKGPMPSEQWFAAVERLHPGATKEIVHDFIDERQHQRAMTAEAVETDREALRGFSNYQMTRLVIVGLLALVVTVGGVAIILAGKPVAGLVLLTGELAVLVAAFLGQRESGEQPPSDSG